MPLDFKFENTRPTMSDEDILADLQRVAEILHPTALTIRAYNANGRYSHATVKKRFGSWNAAIKKIGLEPASVRDIPRDELFDNLREVWISLGRQPRKLEMTQPLSRFTREPYVRHWSGWLAAVRAFLESLDPNAAIEPTPQRERATPARGPREPSLRLRFLVMRRDRFACRSCGRSPATHPGAVLHVDHMTAWVNGGLTTLENLQTLCDRCNLGKGSLPDGAA